jgi:hypothetical protein
MMETRDGDRRQLSSGKDRNMKAFVHPLFSIVAIGWQQLVEA